MTNEGPPPAAAGAREIFLEAIEQPGPQARSAFLDRVCAGRPAVRAAVEDLLRHHQEDTFLETPAIAGARQGRPPDLATSPETPAEKPGDRIGRYRLLQEIGEGGCGTVYMAEQEEPVHRRVALKILKLGMDTRSVVARFEAERQALALMDHPHIARVYDGGATRTGRPYFVMELVCGTRINEFCDENVLGTRERLRLFVQVCQAIQHAHQKGIIHRDIKPSNILVSLHDGTPVPKVIDFGIAKATARKLTEKTVFTAFQAFVGTPAYTSPEQAEGSSLDIDTRSDIYSLGVLLYELLTGKTPFDAKELAASGLEEMRRTILQREPVPPSTRLRTLRKRKSLGAAQRPAGGGGRDLESIHSDLDWIVMKALEKDRSRRYETANDLALDIQRHLANEPVMARPPSGLYRFQKLVQRHQLGFAVAASFALALLIGLGFTTIQVVQKNAALERAVTAEREERFFRRRAENERREAETQELLARQRAYAADMNLLQQALAANNLGRARELLDAQRPPRGWQDLRGWEWRYLWRQCQSDAIFTLCQLPSEVTALSVSPDCRWVALNARDPGISVWDLRSRKEVASFPSGRGVSAFAFSPKTPLLAIASSASESRWFESSRLRFWDAPSATIVGEIILRGECTGLAFSGDGRQILTTATEEPLALWDVASGQRLKSFPSISPNRRSGPTPRLCATPDLSRAAFLLPGGKSFRVVDLRQGSDLWTAPPIEEFVRTIAFSPDGKWIAAGAAFTDPLIRVWDAATGTPLTSLEGHRTWISSLAFSADSSTLYSASGDQTIRAWDIAGRKPVATLRGHRNEVWSMAIASDSSLLVSGCKDGAVNVWDPARHRTDRDATVLPLAVQTWAFAPDGQSVVILDRENRVTRCQGAGFQDRQGILELDEVLFGATFSPDVRYLAGTIPGGAIKVWDLEKLAALPEIATRSLRPSFLGFIGPTNHILFQRGNEGTLVEWDLPAARETRVWAPPDGLARRWGYTFSPSGEWILGLNREGEARLWRRPTGEETDFGLNLKQISQIAFAPDGRSFVVTSVLGVAALWETAPLRRTASLTGFLQGLHSAAFSPDGQRIAVGSDGMEAIKLWSARAPQELLTLAGQGSRFHSTAFSRDGNVLGSCNGAGLLHLWRVPSASDIDRSETPLQH